MHVSPSPGRLAALTAHAADALVPRADDRFRANFLWGRRPMLAACAARLELEGKRDMVWVDLGGGTGENVLMMADYIDLSVFKKIYVVDLCHSLCETVRAAAVVCCCPNASTAAEERRHRCRPKRRWPPAA